MHLIQGIFLFLTSNEPLSLTSNPFLMALAHRLRALQPASATASESYARNHS